jgi:Flp pilus assembly CpaE family ATPase
MRTTVAPALLERLIDELARRYRWVILDVGPELLGADVAAANHRAALARAQHVLLVTGADLVGLWQARGAIDQLERVLGLERRQLNLVLNRHDRRFHHSRQEVEWHLGVPVVAVVPFDHVAMQRAMSEQRPVIVDRASRASRALWVLAESLNDGKLRLPSEAMGPGRRPAFWQRIFGGRGLAAAGRKRLAPERAGVSGRQQQRSRAW